MKPVYPRGKKNRRRRSQSRPGRRFTYERSVSQTDMQVQSWGVGRHLRWSKVPDWVLLAALLIALIYLFVDSRFYVRGVSLSGNSLVSAAEIDEVAGLRTWSIFYVNTGVVADKIRERFPCIRAVNVACRLPAQVLVTVQEREPVAVWEARNGRFLVDAEGVVLKETSRLDDFVLIRNLKSEQVKPGDKVATAPIQTAIELHTLRPQIRLVDYAPESGISLDGPNGWRVLIGLGGDVAAKLTNLDALVRQLQHEGVTSVEYIDVRVEQGPLYRAASGR